MGFEDRGIYLLTGFSLLGIIISLLGPIALSLFKIWPDSATEIILLIAWLNVVLLSVGFPFIITLLISIIYYLRAGLKNKGTNKVIFTSTIIYLVSVPVFILAAINGIVPCLSGPPDGLCMLFGAFLIIPAFILWGIAFIVLIIGILLQFINRKKEIHGKKRGKS